MSPAKGSTDAKGGDRKSWLPTWSYHRSEPTMDSNMEDDALHRKRLAQLLRFVASLNAADGGASHSFVRQVENGRLASNFFQRESEREHQEEGLLCSTVDFRAMVQMETDPGAPVFAAPPFSFYAASSSPRAAARKRTFAGALKRAVSGSADSISMGPEKACWLRITRLTSTQSTPQPDVTSNPAVRQYLEDWRAQVKPPLHSIEELLTPGYLSRAPKVPPNVNVGGSREIKTFLRRAKKYAKKRMYQLSLEPIYNRLFEWIQRQQDHHGELVWGLGHASMLAGDTMISGPLLEVLVEVELCRDGALVVRPREHTGVSLNREVVAALSNANDMATSTHGVLAQLHRDVAELEPSQMAPGQPSTYVPILKRIAVELSSGGCFQNSATSRTGADGKLLVTEAWCLFSRPKPSSVWARDAMAFADQLLLPSPHGGLVLPQATIAFTRGPSALDELQCDNKRDDTGTSPQGLREFISSNVWSKKAEGPVLPPRPMFPLPASQAQNKIADLLINKHYPAVLVEGPPGSGKTQTIANIVCAYLCQGKRVLVTSKNAPALSVLRNRLPLTVQELCVDVSVSELAGMRQLQQTVERLANRVSGVCVDVENEKCLLLKRGIEDLEAELRSIDEKLGQHNEKIQQLVQKPDGRKLMQLSLILIDEVPWLMKTISSWSLKRTIELSERVSGLVLQGMDPVENVSGFDMPPSNKLVSLVASKAGKSLSIVSNMARETMASVPGLGSLSGLRQQSIDLEESISHVRISDSPPETKADWRTVLRALEHARALYAFKQEVWCSFEQKDGWPNLDLSIPKEEVSRMSTCLVKAVERKQLEWKTNVAAEISLAVTCRELDCRRSTISLQIQRLAEELVDANVISELSRSFSADAQSALIRFSQIAGKAKFSSRSSQPSKMTQRQKRRRQEYLDAFDRCCRLIPCWVLTSSQISDYLPPESLFDLVVIDEASQSDATVLPGLLRGRQWLIVGDGKQVSPTESFVSEDHIENLRAALPASPLKESFLPGQSFFDLCSQAFPKGRVVLNEHFRCAEELIAFSNREFYDGRLVPLRLPTKSQRLSPSIIDVKVRNGVKVGKVNSKEADEVVKLIQEFLAEQSADTAAKPRTIGVISLVGDDQSRLIRGRLLDTVGPQLISRHDILVGDPPTFQGAERDIIILSMVCSPGSVPTQSQLMHAQRANVALSRARDRIILVRSIGLNDVPSNEDIKVPILEFFANSGAEDFDEAPVARGEAHRADLRVRNLLEKLLRGRGFAVRDMGVIWKGALCVEHQASDTRAALLVEGTGESFQMWNSAYKQQKAIERVGWRCLRVDALSLLCNFHESCESILQFLQENGIEEPEIVYDALEQGDATDDDLDDPAGDVEEVVDEEEQPSDVVDDAEVVDSCDVVIVISSDDDDEDDSNRKMTAVKPEPVPSGSFENEEVHESIFGEVVDFDFLRSNEHRAPAVASINGGEQPAIAQSNSGKKRSRSDEDAYEYEGDDESADCEEEAGNRRNRSSYRRLDKYQRDGRYHPKPDGTLDADGTRQDWYDTDSDLQEAEAPEEEAA